MRAAHNGLAVLDVRLVTLQPIGARPGKTLKAQSASAIEHLNVMHHFLDGSFELPAVIGGVIVMG